MKLKSILESIILTDEMEDLKKYIHQSSSFDYTGIDDDYMTFSTRRRGNVGRGEYSPLDYKEGQELIKKLKRFYPSVEFDIDTGHEWVTIYANVSKLKSSKK